MPHYCFCNYDRINTIGVMGMNYIITIGFKLFQESYDTDKIVQSILFAVNKDYINGNAFFFKDSTCSFTKIP